MTNIYIGAFEQGQQTNRIALNIDNDSFNVLFNAYAWRGRARRKRGTSLLGQLQRQIQSVASGPTNYQVGPIATLDGSGNATVNLITLFSLGSTVTLTPGSIVLTDGTNMFKEPAKQDGTLVGTPAGSGTINYATGALTIAGGLANAKLYGLFSYYPTLPVMGLRDFTSNAVTAQFPVLLAFDTKYSYQINQSNTPPNFYTTNFFKSSKNPFTWSGFDYQQFWTVNYSGALWATNNKPGFSFQFIDTIVVGTPTTITTSTSHGLNSLDYVFFNEITGTDEALINGMAFQVTVTSPTSFTIDLTTTSLTNSGIFQTLTYANSSQDGIRWYDGDPTSGSGIPTGNGLGWVNFAPPLTALTVSIDNSITAKYYLVGALAIVPFKDRLIFFAPWIQTSSSSPMQLTDTALWSWNGTPYYCALVPSGETFDVTAYYVDQTGKGGYQPAGIPQSIATVTPNEDVLIVGFSGNGRKTRFVYTSNDLQPFNFFTINSELPSGSTFSSVSLDKGAIDLGQYGIALTDQQSSQRIDLNIPDSIFTIQSANNGFQRVNAIRDFKNEWIYFSYPLNTSIWNFPVQTFLFNYRDSTWGVLYENFTAHGRYRQQFKNTWASIGLRYGSWSNWRNPWNAGISTELFSIIIAGNPQGFVLLTDQGTSEGISGTIQSIITDPSGSGATQITSVNHCVSATGILGQGDYLAFDSQIIGQVIGTSDANTFLVDILFPPATSTISAATQATQCVITVIMPNDMTYYFVGQQITISGIAGGSMTQLNGNTYTILAVVQTFDGTFYYNQLTLNVDSTGFTAYVAGSGGTATLGSYIGLNNFIRLSQPLIQTKQFDTFSEEGRKTRLATQKYLMDSTANDQCSVNIFLSQNNINPWNNSPILPSDGSTNDGLVFSQLMYTCPESTNIGLTPANVNLNMPPTGMQQQIWHRFAQGLIGDAIQIGITLNDAQMRNFSYATGEITLHKINLTVYPGPWLA